MNGKTQEVNVLYRHFAIQSTSQGMSWKLITKPSKFNYALIDCLLPFLPSSLLPYIRWELRPPAGPEGEWHMEVTATRNIAAGEELLLSYGECSRRRCLPCMVIAGKGATGSSGTSCPGALQRWGSSCWPGVHLGRAQRKAGASKALLVGLPGSAG